MKQQRARGRPFCAFGARFLPSRRVGLRSQSSCEAPETSFSFGASGVSVMTAHTLTQSLYDCHVTHPRTNSPSREGCSLLSQLMPTSCSERVTLRYIRSDEKLRVFIVIKLWWLLSSAFSYRFQCGEQPGGRSFPHRSENDRTRGFLHE